ncbi:MAG: ATP-binding protein [Verrucomicrobiota bacterium]
MNSEPVPLSTGSLTSEEMLLRRMSAAARTFSTLATLAGLLGVAGRLLPFPLLLNVFPGLPCMKGNTALSLMLLGGALRLLQGGADSTIIRRTVQSLAAIALAIGLITLLEYRFPIDSGQFDQLIFKNQNGEYAPGRMSPNTALTILVSAGALFLLAGHSKKSHRGAQRMAMLILLSGLWTLLGYVFSVTHPTQVHHFSFMALNTALAFVALGLGVLLSQPDTGMMRIFSSHSSAGAMARKVLPASILALFALGTFTFLGLRAGLYDAALCNALFTIASIVWITSVVWHNAYAIDQAARSQARAEGAARRQAEELNDAAAEQYVAMAEAIPQIVWTAQPDGYLDFHNQRWFEYTALSQSESAGDGWMTAIHPDDVVPCAENWKLAIAAASRFEVQARIVRHDNAWRWHLIRALPVFDRAGQIVKWFGTCTDIEEQKRAEESMRFLANAGTILSASSAEIETLQSVAELAVPKIADLCTVHLVLENREQLQLAAVSHMDPKKVELMVETVCRFPPSASQSAGVIRVVQTGRAELTPEIDESDIDSLASNDTHSELLRQLGLRSMMCVPLQGRSDILGVITFASIESARHYSATDLTLAEEVARRTALALENNRLFAKLTETKAEAEAANAAKDQFLAVLSHELRTPLTPVLLSVVAMGRDPDLPQSVRDATETIRRNIELEARLIDDLLDLTRIQCGKLQLQFAPIDAHALLHAALEICDGDIREKKLRISLGLSATRHHVTADPARLQQVFWNLIKNAVKFTPSGGFIAFRSQNTPTGALQIEIEDSGIGIEPRVLPKIFNAFEQGEKSRARRFGGLGLGLTIVKDILEAHGGMISATSPGRDLGTCFLIKLATIDPPAVGQAGPAQTQETQTPGEIRILLVEDDKDTGALLRKILERRGYQVDMANSMQSAIDLAERATYDLLISDIGLPDGSGHEVMRRLREIRFIPGIAMSGFGAHEDICRSYEAGFAEHLIKPLNISKLEEAIKALTARAL